MGGRLVFPGVILDTCWYPHGMPYVILMPFLLSFVKSFLQINKCPSKHESLLTLLGKFTLVLSKKQSDKEDMNWKHLINFSRVIIVWGIIVASTRTLVRLCDKYTFKEFFQYSSYHIRSLFLQLHIQRNLIIRVTRLRYYFWKTDYLAWDKWPYSGQNKRMID